MLHSGVALTVNWLLVNTGIYRAWLTLSKGLKARKLLKATEKKIEMMKKKVKMEKAGRKRKKREKGRKDEKIREQDSKPVGGVFRSKLRYLLASILSSGPTEGNGKEKSRGKSASLSSTAPGDQNV